MPRYCLIVRILLTISMSSFIFPATTSRIRCYAFRHVVTLTPGSINKGRTWRKPHERNNFKSGKPNYRFCSYWSVSPISTGRFDECSDERYSFYESVSAYLFRQGKTWRRLSHLLEMAAGDEDDIDTTIDRKKESIADIGCDHGLLAMGLALTGNYEKVFGVDVSDQALTYGALAMLNKIRNQTRTLDDEGFDFSQDFPIEFRLGNGLEALEPGEADTICIAGMGVNTMLQILDKKPDATVNLEKIGCKRLVLQATNSRPRNLIRLYDGLQKKGWKVQDERIERLSSRWYITTRFEVSNDVGAEKDPEMPGMKLQSIEKTEPMGRIFDEYCLHHKQWIRKDAKVARHPIDPRDLRWLKYFFNETL